MKTIKTQNNELIVIQVPEDAYDFQINSRVTSKFLYWKIPFLRDYKKDMYLPQGLYISLLKDGENVKILGKLSELSEAECKRFVEGFFKHDLSENFDCWKNYFNPSGITYSKSTAKESLISLLQVNELDCSNPHTLFLIEKV